MGDAHQAEAKAVRTEGSLDREATLTVVGLTFDTGALIGLERRRHAMRAVYATAVAHRGPITVPAIVIAEWWRAGLLETERATILRSVRVEPLTDYVARLVGVAVGLVRGAGTVDAVVMASASLRGDIVYTSDPDDLAMLQATVPQFANVRVLAA